MRSGTRASAPCHANEDEVGAGSGKLTDVLERMGNLGLSDIKAG